MHGASNVVCYSLCTICYILCVADPSPLLRFLFTLFVCFSKNMRFAYELFVCFYYQTSLNELLSMNVFVFVFLLFFLFYLNSLTSRCFLIFPFNMISSRKYRCVFKFSSVISGAPKTLFLIFKLVV